jgi:hypothetical protein
MGQHVVIDARERGDAGGYARPDSRALPFEVDVIARGAMTATSMMRCMPGVQPVVSMSTNATGESGEMFS